MRPEQEQIATWLEEQSVILHAAYVIAVQLLSDLSVPGRAQMVELLRRIRQAQRQLASMEVTSQAAPLPAAQPDTSAFVASLSIAWQDGEIRPTHRKQRQGPRRWRTRVDDFREVWPLVEQWLMDVPDTSAKELFLRLQDLAPNQFQPCQLKTLQRRVKACASKMVRHLVFGVGSESATETSASIMAS